MSTEDNKALVRAYFKAIDTGRDVSMLDEFVSPDFVDHNPAPGCTPDLDGLKEEFRIFAQGAPGFHMLDQMLAEGDLVATRVTGRGTHSGEFFDIPPTHENFGASGVVIHRIAEGKIVERWRDMDMLGILLQLGAIGDG